MEASSCILHSEEYEDVSVGSILENNTYNYLWKDCAIAIHTFFVLERYIDLSRYLLSYKELHDSMKYVLSEF